MVHGTCREGGGSPLEKRGVRGDDLALGPSVSRSFSRGDPPPGDRVSAWAGWQALEPRVSALDGEPPIAKPATLMTKMH
jgi:hypothetical protein